MLLKKKFRLASNTAYICLLQFLWFSRFQTPVCL